MDELFFFLIFLSLPIFCFVGFLVFANMVFQFLKKRVPRIQQVGHFQETKKFSHPLVNLPTYAGPTTKWVAVCVSALYVLFIDWWRFPVGAQVTLGVVIFLSAVWYLAQHRNIKHSSTHWALIGIMGVIGGYAMVTSNPFVSALNAVSLVIIAVLLAVELAQGFLPATAMGAATDIWKYFTYSYLQFFSSAVWKNFFQLPKISWKKRTLNSEVLLGIIVSVPVLLTFHFLFSRVNAEYAAFVESIFAQLWQILIYIWELDIVEVVVKTLITSVVVFPFLSTKIPDVSYKLSPQQKAYLSMFHIVVGSSIAIFGVFSFFQAQLMFADFSVLVFKELSTYVIHGFWELVAASIVGYILTLLVLRELEQSHTHHIPATTRNLLTIFTTELIAVVIFTLHKLYVHQFFFGFKDQRLLATVAVLVILITFVLLLFRLWKSWDSAQVFRIQLFTVLGAIVLFNGMNIDLFVTRMNPVSYYVNGAKYKDYSYLLGNSYDNSAEWVTLADEVIAQRPPQPDSNEYYYGWYPSLCQPFVEQGPYSAYRTARSVKNTSYLQDKYAYLEKKYEPAEKRELSEITQFNWSEYQAYLVLAANREKFEQVIDQMCPSSHLK